MDIVRKIKLTNGMTALVDNDDYCLVNQYKWRYWKKPNNITGYAYTSIKINNKWKNSVQMHRLILGLTNPQIITDHKNDNGLDNRKANLRICSKQENNCNVNKRKNNTSGYKGVYKREYGYNLNKYGNKIRYKKKNIWECHIRFSGKTIHIGVFSTKIEAAKAYDKKAKELFGEFARLNFEESDTK